MFIRSIKISSCFVAFLGAAVLTACSHQPKEPFPVKSTKMAEVILPAGFAMSVPASAQSKAPSSECAKNFDGIVGHLEMMMLANAAQHDQTR